MNSETNRIEYKQQLSSDLEIEAIAFLNYHEGGVMYIGIDKTGSVIGVPDIDGDMLKVKEITSFGSLPQGMTEKEFFEGYSVPRNKELMRVFKDLDLVEHLGSGVPRILRSYGKECFKFTENFLRMIFPATEQVTEQVKKLIKVLTNNTLSTNEIMQLQGKKRKVC